LRPAGAFAVGKVTILVGTMTGTAELVAAEVQTTLEGAGLAVSVHLMDDLDASAFKADSVYLICTSTYGNGDVPDNAQAFLADLEERRPDLRNVSFGVIALGDRTYNATFCHGGLRFDATLRELGATRLGDVLQHDAGSGTLAEDIAAGWALGWISDDPSYLANAV